MSTQTNWTHLDDHLFVHHGSINVGIVVSGNEALLIDCGDGSVQDTLADLGVKRVAGMLFTHHHRDQGSGALSLMDKGTWVAVPSSESSLFCAVDGYWADPEHRWHLYDFRPHNLVFAEPIPVHRVLSDGDALHWGPVALFALQTPGHTDGSMSYVVRLCAGAEHKDYLFCGDLMYDKGQVWDLYSLQKGWHTRDYHGFLGDRQRLLQGLRRAKDAQARLLVPSHGEIVYDPAQAIDITCRRIEECYGQYVSVSALHYYFPELLVESPGEVSTMPPCPPLDIPPFLCHIGTTWLIQSEDGPAFMVDCGSPQVVEAIRIKQDGGELSGVEALWLSHYHDDHVDGIPECIEAFECAILMDAHVADVVEWPLGWRLPCISPVRVQPTRRLDHGESWRWHEFAMTAYHLPGQTLYHGALLVEGGGIRVLFVGDSFTPTGMDDYCMGNRNLLGPNVGFDACLDLVETLSPDILLNCHVDVGFCFAREQIRWMRNNLAHRLHSYGQLVAWDNPNYGLDEHWVRCYPYQQQAQPGDHVALSVVIHNHSDCVHTLWCRPCLPDGWRARPSDQTTEILSQHEGRITFEIQVPVGADMHRHVVPIEMTYSGRNLGQFREAILDVTSSLDHGRVVTQAVPCT